VSGSESGFIEAPGARIYYEAEGAGTPIVMIHAGVAHLRMWDEQVETWRDRHRIIRYDTRGWGRTLVEDVPFSNIADVGVVMDHLGVESAHLVGLSRGGQIALDFTIANPDRVRSLTWVASGIGGFELDDPRLVDVWPEMERVEEARDWEKLVEMETRLWTDGPDQPPDRVEPSVRRRMVEWNMENYIAEQPANQPVRPDFVAAERLADITVPVLALWGTLDEAAVPAAGAKLAAEVPGARSHVFEGVAHMVNLERPEEFNRLVGEFVDEVDAAQAADPSR
jgi:pimeloyl-ACP methyl ester carboxylesterase